MTIFASPSTLNCNHQTSSFDFIVVGAGSAGCVVAARLAENPTVSVLLVEAGTRATELEAQMPLACGSLQQTQRDWGLHTESSQHVFQGKNNHQFPYPRGKCLGGCSTNNYMAYVRGASQDYDTWEKEFGATGWSWKDVLPFFKKSEHVEEHTRRVDTMVIDETAHGTDGPLAVSSNPTPGGIPQAFVHGAAHLGFEVDDYNNGTNENKVSIHQQTIQKGKRCDTATAFIFNQPDKPNLTIVTNAQATRLLFHDEDDDDESGGNKVVGVELADLLLVQEGGDSNSTSARFSVRAKKEVIVSSGAIGSPQLLLLSGIGPADELRSLGIQTVRRDLPDVGKNLEDHPTVQTVFAGKEGLEDIGATNGRRAESFTPRALMSLANWALRGKGLHATPAYDASLFFKTHDFAKSHPNYGPDSQIGMFCTIGDQTLWEQNMAVQPRHNFAKSLYDQHDPQGVNIVTTLLHQYSRGSVTLAKNANKDPLAKPVVTLNLLDDDRDMTRMVTQLRKVLELAQTPALQSILQKSPIYHPDMLAKHQCTADNVTDTFLVDYIRHHMFPLYHPTSTCKIGKVVDSNLKVLGIQGLRVADASVFPTNISGNTNAPAIMVGEKAAHMIKEDHALSSSVDSSVCGDNKVDRGAATTTTKSSSTNKTLTLVMAAAAATAVVCVAGIVAGGLSSLDHTTVTRATK